MLIWSRGSPPRLSRFGTSEAADRPISVPSPPGLGDDPAGGSLWRARAARTAAALARQGLDISRSVMYWPGVGAAQRALGRIAQRQGALATAATQLTSPPPIPCSPPCGFRTISRVRCSAPVPWAWCSMEARAEGVRAVAVPPLGRGSAASCSRGTRNEPTRCSGSLLCPIRNASSLLWSVCCSGSRCMP
jgi:hypothetical protein